MCMTLHYFYFDQPAYLRSFKMIDKHCQSGVEAVRTRLTYLSPYTDLAAFPWLLVSTETNTQHLWNETS